MPQKLEDELENGIQCHFVDGVDPLCRNFQWGWIVSI